ncbi:hypothetical protein GO495_14080 [Chitinophaga oryziterrae]|uniref:MoxR-vWA-beta-propeller ternary system domain-containing protein n=1 Tax=Chitinophaga oryziterrae TaxID=1031224 RepID=A0A6N8J9B4_9BACT|nr:hypothetical protein [Chitinophaga oryziterrae]MVT41713.1 hypothetical protein [Chitinophaga oryziterrae]
MNIVLQLTYDPQSSQDIAGTFIRGNTPSQWFREIDNWNIPLNGLTCLIIPAHSGSITPAGLFVVFKSIVPDASVLSHPYAAIGNKLFIPVHASLHPVLSNDELNDLLIWEWQVFHPGIGFVGFNKEDQLEPVSLLSFAEQLTTSWDHAHPGLPPMAKLHEISVDNPEENKLLDQLQEGIDIQPLSEIPGVIKPPTGFMAFLDVVAKMCMLPVWLILKIFSLFPGNPIITVSNNRIQSFMDWMEGEREHDGGGSGSAPTRDNLEKSRNRELERLLKLFDEDMDEALRYAIPLASKYASRGSATPSGSLGSRDTSFNVNRLGGGERADGWNVDNYAASLAAKYHKTALQAEEKRDFKKAAYIYANLLGDFQAAARVLEQGQYYREAAILYREHLHKPLEAAQCLEKGGLLLEAIEIYKELEQYEKTGDLFLLLAQPEKAAQYFRKSTDVALSQKDYQKAATILDKKLHLREEACTTLLDGWSAGYNQEECLTMYFQMIMRTEEDQLPEYLLEIYEHHTPVSMQGNFLSVLTEVNKATTNPAAKETARELAYKIISQDAMTGNTEKMHLLKHFLPEDEQLVTDYNLYKNRKETVSVTDKKGNQIKIQLHENVEWMGSATYYNQMLIFGQDKSALYLVRVNVNGYQEHYSWTFYSSHEDDEDEGNASIVYPFFSPDLNSNNDIVLSLRTLDTIFSVENKDLPANRHFNEELHICVNKQLEQNVLCFAFSINEAVTRLVTITASDKNRLNINHYTEDLGMGSSECTLSNGEVLVPQYLHFMQQMICKDIFYFHMNKCVYSVDYLGHCEELPLDADIFSLTDTPGKKIIARTKKGSILISIERDMKIIGDFFAEHILCVAKAYIPGDLFVIASEYDAQVYNIKNAPILINNIRSTGPIKEILSTGEKNQCVILDNKGVMTIHAI